MANSTPTLSTPTTPEKGFKLKAWAALPALLLLIALMIAEWTKSPQGIEEPLAYSRAIGAWVGSLVLAGLIAIAAYFVTLRRTRVLNIAFFTVMVIALILHSTAAALHARNASRARDAHKMELLVESNKAAVYNAYTDPNATISDQTAASEKLLKDMEQSASTLSGDQARATTALTQTLREVQDAVAPYMQAADVFVQSGGLDPAGIKSIDDTAARLKHLDAMEAANENAERTIATATECFRRRLADAGIENSGSGRAMLRGLQQGVANQQQMRDIQRRFIAASRDYLSVLHTHWGKWTVDAEGSVIFETDEAVEAFNKAFEQVQSATTDEAALVERMMKPDK